MLERNPSPLFVHAKRAFDVSAELAQSAVAFADEAGRIFHPASCTSEWFLAARPWEDSWDSSLAYHLDHFVGVVRELRLARPAA